MDSVVIKNYQDILSRIITVSEHHGRDPKTIQLLVASKKQPPEEIQPLINLFPGIVLGESYVQEFAQKKLSLTGDYQVHLIGPLQSNKAKRAVELFDVIQSISSIKLAKMVSEEASKIQKIQPVYLQVNISNDPQKSGFSREELILALPEIKKFANLEILGLMTITRYYSNVNDVLPDFEQMVQIRDSIGIEFELSNLRLSMGMSADYHLAVQVGADVVRVGSGIFGLRGK